DFRCGVNVKSYLVIFIVPTPRNTELPHVLMSSKDTAHDESVFTRTGRPHGSRDRTVSASTIGTNPPAPVERHFGPPQRVSRLSRLDSRPSSRTGRGSPAGIRRVRCGEYFRRRRGLHR